MLARYHGPRIRGDHQYPLTDEELAALDTRAEQLASVISDAAVVQPQVIGLFAAVRDEIDKYKVRRSAQ